MRTNISTLSKLQVLEILYRSGYQSKMIALELGHVRRELAELNARLKAFEANSQITSDTFYQRYEQGELGDSADFMEWCSFYDMQQSVRQRLEQLDGTSQ